MHARRHLSGGHCLSILAIAICIAVASGAGSGPPQTAPPFAVGFRETAKTPATSLRRSAWQGGVVTASNGQQFTLFVADTYGPDGLQRWTEFFATLPHGSELSKLTAFVAPLGDVQSMCGPEALGCYGGNELATIGEPVDAVSGDEVARHEYGHHVAFNRDNAPWLAVDWGTKRWASYARICPRAAAGTAYPGDEESRYRLNPGEAFAEAYRAMAETRAGAPGFTWPLVDASFYPDAAALKAVEDDVAQPWIGPSTVSASPRFRRNGPKTWSLRLQQPLDGVLEARLTMPKAALYDLSLRAEDDATVLAKSLWSGVSERKLAFQVCGQRSLVLRVARTGPAGRFKLVVTRP